MNNQVNITVKPVKKYIIADGHAYKRHSYFEPIYGAEDMCSECGQAFQSHYNGHCPADTSDTED